VIAPPVTDTVAKHRRAKRRQARTGLTMLAVVAVVAGWLLVLVLATRVQVSAGLQDVARFGHLAALALGFGAALTVEWFGLLWLLRRRSLRLVTQVAQAAHLPIWLGLAGLAATGVALSEQLGATTMVKLVAVLMVALNGVYAARLQRHLSAAGGYLPRSLRRRVIASATVSQLGWWSAAVIGFVNAHT